MATSPSPAVSQLQAKTPETVGASDPNVFTSMLTEENKTDNASKKKSKINQFSVLNQSKSIISYQY